MSHRGGKEEAEGKVANDLRESKEMLEEEEAENFSSSSGRAAVWEGGRVINILITHRVCILNYVNNSHRDFVR